MTIIVDKDEVSKTFKILADNGEDSYLIGEVSETLGVNLI